MRSEIQLRRDQDSRVTVRPRRLEGPAPDRVERRRHRRVCLVAELGVHTRSNFYRGFTNDISEGGVFIVTYTPQPIGTALFLELRLPGGVLLRMSGAVRWVRESRGFDDAELEPPGMGIQFTAIGEEELAAIREFMDNRAPHFSPM